MKYTTRIAPSPTGYFHLGTARTAYFNWLAARATGGRFILRIDDTDETRNDSAMTKVVYDAMAWLGLNYDETFAQSSKRKRYQDVAERMLDEGTAEKRDGAVWLKHDLRTREIRDQTGIVIPRTDLPATVLLKTDGGPTYHFSSVVDDMDCGVTYVIRGSDHVANTMRQVSILEALDAVPPWYAHVGLLHDLAGPKLSKSRGAKSLLDFRDEGVHPEAMLNFLLRLGWGPKKDDASAAILCRDRALQLFLTGGNLRNQSCKVDFAKLAWYDKRYKHDTRTGS